MERLPEQFNLRELFHKVEEKTTYVVVALQQCERMNTLTNEIRKSLKELNMGLKVWANFLITFLEILNFQRIKNYEKNQKRI